MNASDYVDSRPARNDPRLDGNSLRAALVSYATQKGLVATAEEINEATELALLEVYEGKDRRQALNRGRLFLGETPQERSVRAMDEKVALEGAIASIRKRIALSRRLSTEQPGET